MEYEHNRTRVVRPDAWPGAVRVTVIVVLADPPREGLVLPELAETTPLSAAETAELYGAMLQDTFQAAANSGGELLVNYRPNDLLPEAHRTDRSVEAEVRTLAKSALDDIDDVRFEVQVGSTREARAGNTASHLLTEEEVASVALVDGTAPMLTRKEIDSAAMKLRRSEVVIGPSERGRVHFLGLTDTINFEGAYQPPELETLANRGADAGHGVDFIPMLTTVETHDDLVSLLSLLEARRAGGHATPTSTVEVIDDLGLRVAVEDGRRRVAHGEN